MRYNLQEQMAFLETEGARNVIEACGRAAYIRRCIFTSSLLASIWTSSNLDRVIDESCWSSEEFCRENKVLKFIAYKSFLFCYILFMTIYQKVP